MDNKSPFQYRVFNGFYRRAAREMCRECEKFIDSNSRILDFGCGSAIVGKEFAEYFNSEILGVDIIDNRVVKIPFRQYSGKDLSFLPDNSFDAVLINYVLHHTDDPVNSLKEAARVAKKRIIIYENLPEGIISGFFCWLHGISFAYLFQKNAVTGKFLTRNEWKNAFNKLSLKLIYDKNETGFRLMKKALFVLEKE
ncbi:MAG: class I SAM-dependent methyltransferase [Candidatus Pacebacteria bacterium]|nr:class I SAM-dependent methyltransferase [Candidatus Paceibacterota bacterium]